jgi:AraC family transcriptional regulator
MQMNIVTQPPMRVAAIRHIGAYTKIGEAFTRLGAAAAEADLFGPGVAMLGLYHDDPRSVPEGELRSDAAITLRDGAKAPAGTTEMTVAGGRYACGTFRGPYSGLPAAWGELMQWIGQSGEQMADGVSFELYRNDPTDTAPEDLITEICVPVR